MKKQIFESEQELFEAVNAVNDSNIDTADLVKVVKAEHEGDWSKPMTADEFARYLDRL